MTTKVDIRQELKSLYRAGRTPTLIDVPELSCLAVDGSGAPDRPGFQEAFQEAIGALYGVVYTMKFALKKSGGADFTVMPLEALWTTPSGSILEPGGADDWSWTALIVVPRLVCLQDVDAAKETLRGKGRGAGLDRLRLAHLNEGRAAQVLHVGPYAAERPTIEALHAFIAQQGLTATGRHHEIYLGDPRRAAPDRLRTILRQPVGVTAPAEPARAA